MSASEGQRIDWTAAKARLASAERSLQAAFDEDPTKRPMLLRERAQRLARSGAHDAGTEAPLSRFLILYLGKDRYVFALQAISAVSFWQRPCRMPHAHPAMLGLFAEHGTTWALYELAALLGLERAAAGDGGYVLHLRDSRVALRVDGVGSVIAAAPGTARQLPRDTQADPTFLSGLLQDGLIIIDAARIRAHPAFSKDVPE